MLRDNLGEEEEEGPEERRAGEREGQETGESGGWRVGSGGGGAGGKGRAPRSGAPALSGFLLKANHPQRRELHPGKCPGSSWRVKDEVSVFSQ